MSDYEIDIILEKAKSAFKHSKINKSKEEIFLITLASYLREGSDKKENVCHYCLGSGYNG